MSCESNVILESPRPQFARPVLSFTDFGGDAAFFDDKHTNFMVHVVGFFLLDLLLDDFKHCLWPNSFRCSDVMVAVEVV